MRFALITNDVETTSIQNHMLSDETGAYVLNEGMPRLLELYEKYNIKSTFFFTGHIAKLYPEVVRMAYRNGHEVGSHGLTHDHQKAFDILTPEEQLRHLRESKSILEQIIGEEVISFRAPALRVSKSFPSILREAGFKIDSSVSSQRLDMFFSFGSVNKLRWITSPRQCYFTQQDNLFLRGNSDIFEIPISAFGFPYIGTFMRIAPTVNRMVRTLLYWETCINNRPFVFLTHPNEFIDEERNIQQIQRRSKNPLSYFLGDVVRHNLKVRNLGIKAVPLLERELQFFESKRFTFTTCKQLYQNTLYNHAK